MHTSSSPKLLRFLLSVAAIIPVLTQPASADTLFTDLGSGTTVYSRIEGWAVSGSASTRNQSIIQANSFVVSGTGSETVSQIDLGVSNLSGNADTFSVSIYTDASGKPGTQIANALWDLTSSTTFGTCCGPVSVTGISGVTLTGGGEYFLVLSPLSLTDTSYNIFSYNTTGVTGIDDYSSNGSTWPSNGSAQTTGAFDILGSPVAATPEPSSLALLASGLSSAGLLVRRRVSRNVA